MSRRICRFLTATAAFLFFTAAGHGATQDFYQGKTIRIVVGFSPGGAFDAYSRSLSRHMRKYLPGNPSITVENMPGAGSLIAANHLYKAASPDGLTMGNFIGSVLMGQVLGQKGVEFDARRFEYLGAPARYYPVCLFSKASGITSVEKWMAAKTPVKMGGIGQGTSGDNTIRILRATTGVPIQLVSGYKGMAEIRLATEAGEVAGTCVGPRTVWQKSLETGEVIPVLQVTPKPAPDFPKIPLAIDVAKTEEARKLIEVGVHNDSAIALTYALPPGTPKELVAMLRRGFMDTMKDGEFSAELKKARLDVDPVPGEELEKIINDSFKLDPALIGKLKDIFYK
ncbi:MAG TPA: tripartite tricarboxylate transporter substrate-binding protein [Candidatus Binatia bacterium]|nr:tripartite tricarboxylate transporter substrate-binding protein [Candidatus Binatia bacterium]